MMKKCSSAIAGILFVLFLFNFSSLAHAQQPCYSELELNLLEFPEPIILDELELKPVGIKEFEKALASSAEQKAFGNQLVELPHILNSSACEVSPEYFAAGYDAAHQIWLIGEAFDTAVSYELFIADPMQRFALPISYDHGFNEALITPNGDLLIVASYDIPEYYHYYDYRAELFLISFDESGALGIDRFLCSHQFSIVEVAFVGSNEIVFSAYAGRSEENGMSYFSFRIP